MSKFLSCSLLICLLTPALAMPVGVTPQSEGRKVVLGILPVYDISGETFGEVFTQNLTTMIFEELKEKGVEPVLLNPGGAYTPDGLEWIADYAQHFHADAALISILRRTDRPRKGDWVLRLETQIYRLQSHQLGSVSTFTRPISKKQVQRGLEVGISTAAWYGPSRPFEKQPLGKAARHMAREVKQRVMTEVSSISPSGSEPPSRLSRDGSCTIDFRVLYTGRRAASKSYLLVVNNREESAGIKDGTATLDLRSGPILLQVTLKDTPYRLPAQSTYLADTYLDCGQPERTLSMQIGAAGEALLVWK